MAKAKSPRTGNSPSKKVLSMPVVEAQTPIQAASLHRESQAQESKTRSSSARDRNPAPFRIDMEAEIRRRAYQIYEERGGHPGSEQQDWALAEREVMARYNQQRSA